MKKALSPSGEGALKGRRLAPRIRASPLPVPGMVEKAGICPLAARGKRRTRWTGALICKDLGARIRRRSLRPYQQTAKHPIVSVFNGKFLFQFQRF
jgi:hypothetical protein